MRKAGQGARDTCTGQSPPGRAVGKAVGRKEYEREEQARRES